MAEPSAVEKLVGEWLANGHPAHANQLHAAIAADKASADLDRANKAIDLLHIYFSQVRDDTSSKHDMNSCRSCTDVENKVRVFLGIKERAIVAPRQAAATVKEHTLTDKERTYENEYILPCFEWAREIGYDLQQEVFDNPGKNCVELLVRHLITSSAALESDRRVSDTGTPKHCHTAPENHPMPMSWLDDAMRNCPEIECQEFVRQKEAKWATRAAALQQAYVEPAVCQCTHYKEDHLQGQCGHLGCPCEKYTEKWYCPNWGKSGGCPHPQRGDCSRHKNTGTVCVCECHPTFDACPYPTPNNPLLIDSPEMKDRPLDWLKTQAVGDRTYLRAVLERDRTKVAEHVTAIKKELQSFSWLKEGRGSYEWNDDRWHQEFDIACQAIWESIAPLERIGADWTNCPKTWVEVKSARETQESPSGYRSAAEQRVVLEAQLAEAKWHRHEVAGPWEERETNRTLITILMHQSTRIEELETKLAALPVGTRGEVGK